MTTAIINDEWTILYVCPWEILFWLLIEYGRQHDNELTVVQTANAACEVITVLTEKNVHL